MLDHRLRRWPNIKPLLVQRILLNVNVSANIAPLSVDHVDPRVIIIVGTKLDKRHRHWLNKIENDQS